MKFEVYEDKKKQFRLRIRANDGKILCHSEGYINKRGAVHAAWLVFLHSHTDNVSELNTCEFRR